MEVTDKGHEVVFLTWSVHSANRQTEDGYSSWKVAVERRFLVPWIDIECECEVRNEIKE